MFERSMRSRIVIRHCTNTLQRTA